MQIICHETVQKMQARHIPMKMWKRLEIAGLGQNCETDIHLYWTQLPCSVLISLQGHQQLFKSRKTNVLSSLYLERCYSLYYYSSQ